MNTFRSATVDILLGIVVFSCIGQGAIQDGAPADRDAIAVKNWLSRSANPVKTFEAGEDFVDLKPLKSILKNVSVVGLGEGSHGTREFFQLKHRMIEFLVTEMGFSLLIAEVNYSTSLVIDDYLLSRGDHTHAESIPKPWPMDTLEWTNMLDWARDYNRGVPEKRKIRFVGYDSKPNKNVLPTVINYLRRVAVDQVEFAKNALSPVVDEPSVESDLAVTLPGAGRPQRSSEEKEQIRKNLSTLLTFFSSNRTKFVRLTSPGEFDRVEHLVRTVAQYDDTFSRRWVSQSDRLTTGIAIREQYANENIQRFINRHTDGRKAIIWAHNGHVSKGFIYADVPTLGSYLHKEFGRSYYAMGFLFDRGTFQARNLDQEDSGYGGVQEFVIKPSSPESIEWYFARPPIKNYFIDFRTTADNPNIRSWLNTPRPMRYLLGGGFSYRWAAEVYTRPIIIGEYYDGIAFVAEATRARPNVGGIRDPLKRS